MFWFGLCLLLYAYVFYDLMTFGLLEHAWRNWKWRSKPLSHAISAHSSITHSAFVRRRTLARSIPEHEVHCFLHHGTASLRPRLRILKRCAHSFRRSDFMLYHDAPLTMMDTIRHRHRLLHRLTTTINTWARRPHAPQDRGGVRYLLLLKYVIDTAVTTYT